MIRRSRLLRNANRLGKIIGDVTPAAFAGGIFDCNKISAYRGRLQGLCVVGRSRTAAGVSDPMDKVFSAGGRAFRPLTGSGTRCPVGSAAARAVPVPVPVGVLYAGINEVNSPRYARAAGADGAWAESSLCPP